LPDGRRFVCESGQGFFLIMTDTPYYSPNLLAQYQDSLKDYRDLKNSLDTYYGEGLQEGSLSEKKSIALNALKKGFDNAIARELTGLSLEDIARLRKENRL
jgi:hypothetical protein